MDLIKLKTCLDVMGSNYRPHHKFCDVQRSKPRNIIEATMEMEGEVQDIVIVGAGIAGLTTALGLHRQGIGSIVLESSDGLRASGFALTIWANAWRALDAIGIGETLRRQHLRLDTVEVTSLVSGLVTSRVSLTTKGKYGEHEIRCVKRQLLMEALVKDLPSGTIRYSCKLVSIEECGNFKLLHLADGSTLKAKVLIGCDGVNSIVAKWLGLKKPYFTGRSALRGFVNFNSIHGFDPKFLQFFGKGNRSGIMPCDEHTLYWFFTEYSSTQDREIEENPTEMKKRVTSTFETMPDKVRNVIEKTELDGFISSPLRYRRPWELIWGNISRGNVCVAGDALHPMTPDIGQGGCSSLEDGVVLARCLGEALGKKMEGEGSDDEVYKKIEKGLEKYGSERRWRSIDLITTSYVVGFIQQNNGNVLNFLRDKVLAKVLAKMLLSKSDFDCGKLS